MSDLALGKTLTTGIAPSQFANPSNASDGNAATAATRGGGAAATPPFTTYLQVDLGSSRRIGRMELLEASNTGFIYYPYWSTDGSTWHLATGRVRTYLGSNRSRYDFDPEVAQYWRLVDLAIVGGAHPGITWKTWTVEPVAPEADFSAAPNPALVDADIDFTDESTADVTAWLWTFGDGDTSTDQNPVHAYSAPGVYAVSLTVTSPDGSDTETKSGYVVVGTPDPIGWDVYAATSPNGALLATIDGAATGRSVRVELNGPGSGKFTINRFLPEAAAAVMAKGNILKCRFPWREDYDAAIILEKGDFKLATKDERGGENLDYGGRGILAYLSRARMWFEAFTVGVDINDTWAKIWQTSKVPNPVGSALDPNDSDYVYAISTNRKIYRIRQADQVAVSSSPALWSGSTKYAGGLGADPSDATILWALESPWAFGASGNTKIRKVRISDWAILATYDLGSAVQLTAIKADASNLWTTKYSTDKIEKRSKADGSVVTSYDITYGGVAQTNPTGISVNGTKLAYWFEDKKRALIADTTDPETIDDVIKTTGLSAFGGDWTTEGGEDFFYPVSHTADVVWKYQLTAATPRDPVDGIWRLDEGSAGASLWRIIQEAQAVGRPQQPIPDLSYGFTSALDSNGDPWEPHDGALEYDAKIGDDVLPTCLRLIPFGIVEQMSPYLELKAYNASTYGVDRTGAAFGAGVVRFEKGVNIVPDLSRKEREREVHSVMLAEGKDRLYATAESDDLGYVREGFIRTDIEDPTALGGTADAELDNERVINERIVFRVVRGPDDGSGEDDGLYLPFTHYNVGDLVRLHTGTGGLDHNEADVRIYAMTLEEGAAGDFGTIVIEAGSAYLDDAAPTTQSGGSSSGGSGTTVIPSPTSVTLRDSETGDEASGRTIESPDIGVYQSASGVAGFTVKRLKLAELSDAALAAIADGQGIRWNATLEVWEPAYHEDTSTAETDTTKVFRPDGTGGVEAVNAEAVGDAEGPVAIRYAFSTTTTDSDPGAGIIRLSNATQYLAVTARLDLADIAGADVTNLLDLIGNQTGSPKGYLRIQKSDDPTKWLVATVSAIATPGGGGYRNVTIANIAKSANSPFASGDAVTVMFATSTEGISGSSAPPAKEDGSTVVATPAGYDFRHGLDVTSSGGDARIAVDEGELDHALLGSNQAITTSGHTIATAKLAGRSTAATGAIEEIGVGTGLSLAGGTLSATGVASALPNIGGYRGTANTAETNAGTANIVLPVAPNTGDIVIIGAGIEGTGVDLTPSGSNWTFTKLVDNNNNRRSMIWKGVASASAATTILMTRASGALWWFAAAALYDNSELAGTLHKSDTNTNASASSQVAIAGPIVPTQNCVIVVVGAWGSGATSPAQRGNPFTTLFGASMGYFGIRKGAIASDPIGAVLNGGKSTSWSCTMAAII